MFYVPPRFARNDVLLAMLRQLAALPRKPGWAWRVVLEARLRLARGELSGGEAEEVRRLLAMLENPVRRLPEGEQVLVECSNVKGWLSCIVAHVNIVDGIVVYYDVAYVEDPYTAEKLAKEMSEKLQLPVTRLS